MPIEFPCPQCNQKLRTPDGTEGRKTKCPQCESIVDVPVSTTAGPAEIPSGKPAPNNPLPSMSVPDPAPQNPFAESAHSKNSLNPYESPQQADGSIDPNLSGEEIARSKVKGPAIGLMVSSGIALAYQIINTIYISMVGLDSITFGGPALSPEEEMGRMVGMVCMTIWVFGLYSLVLYGAFRMLNLRSQGAARTAAILSLFPCSLCCWIGLPFGIWALVVLSNPIVKAGFQKQI